VGLFVHHQGPLADGQYVLGIIAIQGYDTGLIYHDLVIVNDQGIGSTQVHGYFLRKEIE
jgi:hypothetical protein